MRGAPARHGARHRERGRQDAALRHIGEPALGKPVDARAACRTPAAVEIAHALFGGVVDEPEGIAAHARHVRVNDGQHRARGDRGIDGRAAGAQHVDPRRGRQRMRRGDHAVGCEGGRSAGVDVEHAWSPAVWSSTVSTAAPPLSAPARMKSSPNARTGLIGRWAMRVSVAGSTSSTRKAARVVRKISTTTEQRATPTSRDTLDQAPRRVSIPARSPLPSVRDRMGPVAVAPTFWQGSARVAPSNGCASACAAARQRPSRGVKARSGSWVHDISALAG
jgi:hypothetical protein